MMPSRRLPLSLPAVTRYTSTSRPLVHRRVSSEKVRELIAVYQRATVATQTAGTRRAAWASRLAPSI